MSNKEYFGHATIVTGVHIPLTESDAQAFLEAAEQQAAERRERIPDTASALRLICDAKEILRQQGWSDAVYCPNDGSLFAVVQWGASGIFESFYMGEWPAGHLYVCDYLCDPSGLMWKAIDKLSEAEKAQLDKCMASERVSMERDIAFFATQQTHNHNERKTMKMLKFTALGVGGFIALLTFSWVMLDVSGSFAAKREAIRTKVHAESQSYVDGMRTELGRLKLEWDKADHAGRIGIESHIRDTYVRVDTSSYPEALKQFLTELGVH